MKPCNTAFGGGKTHGLVALVHTARGMAGIGDAAEFLDPALVPARPVRVAAFDGVNADPANGRRMDGEVRARTPWGEIAYALGGRVGFELVRASDETGAAPGAGTLRELFGGAPAPVLRRRLFESIDDAAAGPALDTYRALWAANREALPEAAARPEAEAALRACYPFHPEVLNVLTGKTARRSCQPIRPVSSGRGRCRRGRTFALGGRGADGLHIRSPAHGQAGRVRGVRAQ